MYARLNQPQPALSQPTPPWVITLYRSRSAYYRSWPWSQ